MFKIIATKCLLRSSTIIQIFLMIVTFFAIFLLCVSTLSTLEEVLQEEDDVSMVDKMFAESDAIVELEKGQLMRQRYIASKMIPCERWQGTQV